MRYVTDIHALNLNCDLNTTGDWHQSALQWDHPRMAESEDSVLGDWGIVRNSPVHLPEHGSQRFNVSNHLRALVDMLAAGRFTLAQGMRKDFIDTSEYDDEIFAHIKLLRYQPNWAEIDAFMKKEYGRKWIENDQGNVS